MANLLQRFFTKKKSIQILDHHDLYRRIHPSQANGEKIISGAFNDYNLSVVLAKLSSPQKTLKGFHGYGLVSLITGFLRNECEQEVLHDPIRSNHAHSLVRGKKNKKMQRKIRDHAKTIQLPLEIP